MSDKQWQAMLDVHVTAPFKLIQALTPLMREAAKQEQAAGGEASPRSIINISSTSGTHGKFALETLTEAWFETNHCQSD